MFSDSLLRSFNIYIVTTIYEVLTATKLQCYGVDTTHYYFIEMHSFNYTIVRHIFLCSQNSFIKVSQTEFHFKKKFYVIVIEYIIVNT